MVSPRSAALGGSPDRASTAIVRRRPPPRHNAVGRSGLCRMPRCWLPSAPCSPPARFMAKAIARCGPDWPRAFFTEAGLAALRQLVLDRRAMDPERFAHLRAELGLDA